jgi:hypothetical protein
MRKQVWHKLSQSDIAGAGVSLKDKIVNKTARIVKNKSGTYFE